MHVRRPEPIARELGLVEIVPAARRRAVRRTIVDIRSHEGTLGGGTLYARPDAPAQ